MTRLRVVLVRFEELLIRPPLSGLLKKVGRLVRAARQTLHLEVGVVQTLPIQLDGEKNSSPQV